MTVEPLRRPAEQERLRVLRGRRSRRPALTPWVIMVIIAVVAFFGLGFARTSLDKSAFELTELNKAIDEQIAINQQLSLEIARLESPARIAPLAEDLGLVIPRNTRQLIVDLAPGGPSLTEAGDDGSTQ